MMSRDVVSTRTSRDFGISGFGVFSTGLGAGGGGLNINLTRIVIAINKITTMCPNMTQLAYGTLLTPILVKMAIVAVS
jgi:hypothetical protein